MFYAALFGKVSNTRGAIADKPNATLNLTEPTSWNVLGESNNAQFSGRLIGGCIDTEYFDIESFMHTFKIDGVVLYLENAEMSPTMFLRTLLSMKYKGVFNLVNGVLIGRNAVTDNCGKDMNSFEAISDALGELTIAVVYDAEIGHLPPNMTLINGAYVEVVVGKGQAQVLQTLK